MLRIVTVQRDDGYTISLHGRLADEWVELLDRSWQTLANQVPQPRVTTVLTDVSYVDARGERLLARMWRAGVELVASGCMNRHLIERIQGQLASGPSAARSTSGKGIGQ